MSCRFRLICNTFILLLCYGCVEEIDLISETQFESALVVEATITNELKHQEVKLSRAYRLEEDGPAPETDASVQVSDENGIIYSFTETTPGWYRSVAAFAAQEDLSYELQIVTSNGSQYRSTAMAFQQATEIDSVYVERNFNENNEEGVSVFVDTDDQTLDSLYYRFEYEETYKIIAPLYAPFELVVNNDDFPYQPEVLFGLTNDEIIEFFVIKQERPEQEQICYNTVLSNTIILANTADFQQNALERFRIRFVNRDNYIITHRYSILVKQYVQSPAAHRFYETLNNFSASENLFSEIQTGFLSGNVFSVTNPSEAIAGFFEVSSYDEERIYFNYDDLFPGESIPPYVMVCDDLFTPQLYTADPITGIIGDSPIQRAILRGEQFFEDNLNDDEELVVSNPYVMVFPPCGDCTVLGETAIPDFWED